MKPGGLLAHYEITAPIAEGGMGEVYRARDSRLDRDVAVKVLPERLSANPAALHRFEREARTVAQLNHPHIVAVYDVGTEAGVHFVVMELLEGESLAERIAQGEVPLRRALEWGQQIVRGLAAAHDRGVVHRDIKPGNLYLTRDGQIKILDFGLAQVDDQHAAANDDTVSIDPDASRGQVVGTLGYMAPEQVRGLPLDARADLFSFGVVLYELLSAQRAFKEPHAVDTMQAILHKDPPPIPPERHVAPALERVVRRCLEKDPAHRFQSARDLLFALEALGDASSQHLGPASTSTAPSPPRTALAVGVGAVLVAATAAAYHRGLERGHAAAVESVEARRLTYRRGFVGKARFTTDGATAILDASWEGQPLAIFSLRLDTLELQPLGLERMALLSVGARELALQIDPRRWMGQRMGTLARAPITGGPPRQLREEIADADWDAQGDEITALTLEQTVLPTLDAPPVQAPPGAVRLRRSPSGRIAVMGDELALLQPEGQWRVLARQRATGLAWVNERLWYTTDATGGASSLWSAGAEGEPELVYRFVGSARLLDADAGGRALVDLATDHIELFGYGGDQAGAASLAIRPGTLAEDISDDGTTVLLYGPVPGEGPEHYEFHVRSIDGGAPVRLGEGRAYDLSADGAWVIAQPDPAKAVLELVPTGPGTSMQIPVDGLEGSLVAWFVPDQRHLLVAGNEPGRRGRMWLVDIDGGKPQALTPEGFDNFAGEQVLAPDGLHFHATDGATSMVFTLDGAEPQPIPGFQRNDVVAGWTADSKGLWIFHRDEVPSALLRLDLDTGNRFHHRTVDLPDPAGVSGTSRMQVSPAGDTLVVSFERRSSELYLVQGLVR